MRQALSLYLDDEIVAEFQRLAASRGRSVEAELQTLVELNRQFRPKEPERLGRLSQELRAMRLPDGPSGEDSTLLIRWDRDTDHGRSLDDGWTDDAGD